ncbi:hypothetical protein ACFY7Y_32450 [Streptomyces virginiae]|uniref:hypothetical protein n=1 Tax=Streptomyces virginiae TaxID=1961 RepID=UPI000527A874|nr:hypothetical protein [Streptomyces virginiae]
MPSVSGLLEQRELTARRRVEALREEADRVQAELVAAEQDWKEWLIARSRVGEVLAMSGDEAAVRDASKAVRDTDPQPETPTEAAKAKSVVPVWRVGLAWSALSVDYQRILSVLSDRGCLGQGPLTCQEMAVAFGIEAVPAKVETLRSKAKRLVARGWLAESAPGQFTLMPGLAGPGGGS